MENKLKNSEGFIKSVSGRKISFSVPNKYFDEIENHIPSFLSEDKLPKTTSFKTPKNYFNTLETRILSKATIVKKEVKVISLTKRILKYTSIVAAASVLLFIGITYFSYTNTEEITFENLAEADIENWWLEHSPTISTQDIAMVITDDELMENEFTFTNIPDDEIEGYIISIDNVSILNEIN